MFRTVVIKKSSKLSTIQGYLIIYDGDKETKIFLDEITCLMIESNRCLITVPLINELVRRNISVIICNEKHNPSANILGLYNNYEPYVRIKKQLAWTKKDKKITWQYIVYQKINMQLQLLKMLDKPNQHLLEQYLTEIEEYDSTNREGHAAKVYFNSLFGTGFNRDEETLANSMLNYGYSILLSCFNRELVARGYLTEMGIFHIHPNNKFNLSSDLMEPFRPFVDLCAILNMGSKNPKKEIRKILQYQARYKGKIRYLSDIINLYVLDVINFLNKKTINTGFDLEFLKLEEYQNEDKGNENNSNV